MNSFSYLPKVFQRTPKVSQSARKQMYKLVYWDTSFATYLSHRFKKEFQAGICTHYLAGYVSLKQFKKPAVFIWVSILLDKGAGILKTFNGKEGTNRVPSETTLQSLQDYKWMKCSCLALFSLSAEHQNTFSLTLC